MGDPGGTVSRDSAEIGRDPKSDPSDTVSAGNAEMGEVGWVGGAGSKVL